MIVANKDEDKLTTSIRERYKLIKTTENSKITKTYESIKKALLLNNKRATLINNKHTN